MSSVWGNFMNFLESPSGWMFYVFLLGLIVWLSINVAAFLRQWTDHPGGFSSLPPTRRWGFAGLQYARFLSVLGVVVILITPLLPGGLLTLRSLSGAALLVGLMLYGMGIIWLTTFMAKQRTKAIAGVVWASCILLLTGLDAGAAGFASAGLGSYLNILGSVALITGSLAVVMAARQGIVEVPAHSV